VDIVNLQMPLYPSTQHFFNDRMFSLMKRGAYLINTACGKLVERDAVVRAWNPASLLATPATFDSRNRRRRIVLGGLCPSTA
jgi:phosphoglycerate dehydrogenase-like enzyme